jgi:glutamate synthase (ferredoxin)
VAVALGPVGWNVGAGMTGGVAYLSEWGQLNPDSVTVRPVPTEDAWQLRELVEEHYRRTGSRRAGELLSDWEGALQQFRQLVPKAAQPAPTPVPAQPEAARV